MTAHKQTTDGNDYTTAYSYNLSGALVEETYPSTRKVKNTIDINGDLSKVASKKNSSAGYYYNYANNFTYNAAGAVTSMQLGNGRWESITFNSRLQPTQIALGTVQNATDKLRLNYDYGTTANNGNVLSQTITVPTVGSNAGFTATQNYSYDSLNRLSDATETIAGSQSWRQVFSYDRYGNRNFVTGTGNTTTIPVGCSDVECNPTLSTTNNRMSSCQGYSYDSSGNTTGDAENRTFVYDAENKQVLVTASGTTIGQYFYDGDGKRVKKYVPSTGEVTVFVYDASGNSIAEYSTIVAPVQDAKVAYLTADHLDSPRINTDANGAVIARHDYHPFGEEISASQRTTGLGYPSGSDGVRKQFTGYERDPEINLDFAGARMYQAQLGRFTTTDPVLMLTQRLVDPQQINLYSYVRNNPLKYIDPFGDKLKLTGNVQDAMNYLAQILGTQDAANRITYDEKTNTLTVDLSGIHLAENEGANLINDLVQADQVFEFSIGVSAETLGGRQFLAASGQDLLNLDNNPDDRYKKGDKDKPQKGTDDLVAFDPAANQFVSTNENAKKLKKPPLWTAMFHELAEAYDKVKNGHQYSVAHAKAVNREGILRNQRPYLKDYVPGSGGPAPGQITISQGPLLGYGKKVQKKIEKSEWVAKKKP